MQNLEKTSLRESGAEGGRVPDAIKSRSEQKARIIPEENKSHTYISGFHGDGDGIRIIPKQNKSC